MPKNIHKYGIDPTTLEGKQVLIEIALLCAKHENYELAEYIHNFGIDHIRRSESQKALIQIALGLSTTRPQSMARYIESFHNGIAMEAAKQNGTETSQYIQNYGFNVNSPEGQNALFEIAKQSVKQNALGTYKYLSKYSLDITSPEGQKRLEELSNHIFIFLLMQTHNWSRYEFPNGFNQLKSEFVPMDGVATYKFSQGKPFLDLFSNFVSKDIKLKLEECFSLCETHFKLTRNDLAWVSKKLAKTEDLFNQKRFLEWFILTAALCCMRQDLGILFQSQQKLLSIISKRDPVLREALTKEFIYLSFSQKQAVLTEYREVSEQIVHNELACLLLSHFPTDGQDTSINFLKKMKTERDFKVGSHQKLLLEVLLKIKECDLSFKLKNAVMTFFTQMPLNERLRSFRLVYDLLNFKAESFLSEIKSSHILLMGTEVHGSCQRVEGSIHQNKCLLGYFLDGKHRLGIVCNAQGKILARTVFRLLIDTKGQPVLYQEVVYVGDNCENSTGLLRQLAVKKALNLGIPLTVNRGDSESKEACEYPHSLLAKGKPVPFEYVDALRSIKSGTYTLDNVSQIPTDGS